MTIYDELQNDIDEAMDELDQTGVILRIYTDTEDADDPGAKPTRSLSQSITLKAAGEGFSPMRQDKNSLIEQDEITMVFSAKGLAVTPQLDHKIWDGSHEYAIKNIVRIPEFGPTVVAYEMVLSR